jgi:peptide deformylase
MGAGERMMSNKANASPIKKYLKYKYCELIRVFIIFANIYLIMIYPIVAYGDPVLKKPSVNIEKGSVDVKKLSEDMFETMYYARGVGLAAPQIGMNLRIFVADSTPLDDDGEEEEEVQVKEPKGIKKVFINATILKEDGKDWGYEEGCLSIPGIRSEVIRPEKLKIHYFDEHWVEHTEEYDGIQARIIQHEYDHIEGILFIEYLSAIKKRLIKAKLINISKGVVDVNYKMKFPVKAK